MNKFQILTNENKTIGKKQRQRHIIIKHRNDTPMTLNEVKQISQKIETTYEKKYKKKPKMLILGLPITGRFQLKSYDEDYTDMIENEAEYFENKVRDDTKFKTFFKIEIYIYY